MTELRQQTVAGVRWMGLSQIFVQVARFVFTAVMARFVSPSEFGLYQMAAVFTGFASLLCDVGLGAALVQQKEIEERHLNSTFWLNVGISVMLAVGLCLFSGVLARTYQKPVVAILICVVSADFVISSLAIVHRALVIRAMDFRRLAVAEAAGIVGGGVTGVIFAVLGGGVWSIAALVLGTTGVTTLMLWRAQTWRPAFVIRGMVSRELLNFGLHLQGFNLVNYWLRNLDKLLIGRNFGEAALGLYSRAYSAMLLPQAQVSAVLDRVMWPALARCGDDRARLRGAYLQALRLVSFVSLPLMLGLMVVAEDFVRVLYGPSWTGCVRTLQLLCIAGAAQAPGSTAGWLYLATGNTRKLLIWGIGAGVVIGTGMFAGVVWGSINRVAAIYAAVSLVLVAPTFIVAGSCVGLKLRDAASAIGGSLVASLFMALVVTVLVRSLPNCPPPLRLAAGVLVGTTSYAGIAWVSRMNVARELVTLAREMIHKSKPAGMGRG